MPYRCKKKKSVSIVIFFFPPKKVFFNFLNQGPYSLADNKTYSIC